MVVLDVADQRLEAYTNHQRVLVGVGEVVVDDPVFAALGRRRDAAVERPTVVVKRLHGVGSVTRLQVGKACAVGHDELQRLDVGVVDRRVVNVAEHAVG